MRNASKVWQGVWGKQSEMKIRRESCSLGEGIWKWINLQRVTNRKTKSRSIFQIVIPILSQQFLTLYPLGIQHIPPNGKLENHHLQNWLTFVVDIRDMLVPSGGVNPPPPWVLLISTITIADCSRHATADLLRTAGNMVKFRPVNFAPGLSYGKTCRVPPFLWRWPPPF